MELRDAAQVIRDTVSMDQVLSLYGYQPRHGFMVCPFHGDHDASLKVYPGTGGWHCFGCGAGGSVIDFVMEHDGCNFQTAVKALDNAMELGLLKPGDPFDDGHRQRYMSVLDALTELLLQEVADKEKEIEIWLRIRTKEASEIECKPKRERTAKELADLENLYEQMQYDEDRKVRCDRLREEVQAWRREKRRQGIRKVR